MSDLLHRGLNATTPAQEKDGLVVFRLPADSPTVTTEDVLRIGADVARNKASKTQIKSRQLARVAR